jgi:hypothetical protein
MKCVLRIGAPRRKAAEAGRRDEPASRRLPVDNPYEAAKASLLARRARSRIGNESAPTLALGLAVSTPQVLNKGSERASHASLCEERTDE